MCCVHKLSRERESSNARLRYLDDELASKEFDKRVKIAELMLKEADIKNKSKIVEMQMADKRNKISGMEDDFLEELTKELSGGR